MTTIDNHPLNSKQAIVERSTLSADGFNTSADLDIVHQLLKKPRYNIPEELRERIITKSGEILESKDPKEAIMAAKIVLEADKRNMELLKMVVPKKTEIRDCRKMSDEELLEEYHRVTKLLPTIIDGEFTVE